MTRKGLACAAVWVGACGVVWAEEATPVAPEVPRIDSVEMLEPQPHESDRATIWYDDFNGVEKRYTESKGGRDAREAFGGGGLSMLCRYVKGSRGVGNRKVFFGDSPVGRVVRRGEQFDDVYWRIYVKHQHGWQGGGPAKLSRATSIVSRNWAQAMIAHAWSSGEALTLDPASGVRDARVVTTRYNDFGNLRWLGNRPASQFKISSTKEAGRWVCVEVRAKLNTPGKKDGINRLWIDGRLEAERTGLDWRGVYNEHGINAVFLETYWNRGSPVTQDRWIDNFVVSTKPIGLVVTSRNPMLIKTPYHGPGKPESWEAEISEDDFGKRVVWKSSLLPTTRRARVTNTNGRFVGPLVGKDRLTADRIYYARVRQRNDLGQWSDWSPWHQPFRTAGGE